MVGASLVLLSLFPFPWPGWWLDQKRGEAEMRGVSWGIIVGATIGLVSGALLAVAALLCVRFQKKRARLRNSSSLRAATAPMRTNGVDACAEPSDASTVGQESPVRREANARGLSFWVEESRRRNPVSFSGVLKYLYKDLQKATRNFTTLIGQGAFGPVYTAQMATGEIVAVKVLASNSKQGEREFQSEVLLLGRLHHRNLVNLVGYCAEKGQYMLVYVYMSNGSLASHLYGIAGEKHEPLSWDSRVNIALDVARGLEYLHDGAIPPVVHRDIKSANILLDHSMVARVADFGLSREEIVSQHGSIIRGTFGYLDPEYVSSRSYTKKSDVYSFGVLLFELIAGRNPQQGLMEYVELAAMDAGGRDGWEEIADSRLHGDFDVRELNDIASLAYKCTSRISRKRPSMRDMVQSLSKIINARNSRIRRSRRSFPTAVEASIDIETSEYQSSQSEHQREESLDSLSDFPEV
ncbi:hypothetical protein ZIOFF_008903 [Zingiber officinale]|uniref:Protein kinase domain-containing protein n=1 Tax=Zingiber officinale TaxID=94328 RepID=A0A8J5LU33_ZINOF|nr:hypothetical protein ZIOFF_008903 [Zingiber officinale]